MLITKLYAATTAEFAAKPNPEGCASPTHILLTSNLKPMNNQTSTPNRFQAINWSNYSQASQQGPIEPTFKLAFIDCEHTHEYGSDAQFWKEYSQVIEINADGDIVNSTYFVTL